MPKPCSLLLTLGQESSAGGKGGILSFLSYDALGKFHLLVMGEKLDQSNLPTENKIKPGQIISKKGLYRRYWRIPKSGQILRRHLCKRNC